jgi:hypothetical protein
MYDASGNLIGTESIYTSLDKLLPGDTSPFSTYSEEWSNVDRFDFLVEGYEVANEQPAEGLEIVNHTSYTDDYYLTLVGEISNNSDRPMGYVKIAAAIYGKDGTLLNTNYTYTMLDYLAPGGKSPFKVWFSENWQDADTYEIQVQGEYYDDMPEQVLVVEDYSVQQDTTTCTISGTAKNSSASEITYGMIVASFYDANDALLEAEWNFTEGDTIPAGTSVPFEVISYNCPEYDHMEVVAGN